MMNRGPSFNLIRGVLAAACLLASAAGAAETRTYEPAWESLSRRTVPEWMKESSTEIPKDVQKDARVEGKIELELERLLKGGK